MQFFQVLSFMTMFVVIVHTAGQHNDCLDYDKVNEDGLNIRSIYRECGFIDDKKVQVTSNTLQCIIDKLKEGNEDGSLNRDRILSVFKQFTNPEYMDRVLALVENTIKQPRENLLKYFLEGMTLICPKDSFYGKK